MKSDGAARKKVAIVGAGFSGTLLAVHLAQLGSKVSLIERRGRFAAGAAYSTPDRCHLLNVRAGNMSAFPDDLSHFAEWLSRRGEGDIETFAPRRTYGVYLAELLEQEGAAIDCIEGAVTSLAEAGCGVRLQISEGEVEADVAVLAGGNLPPQPPGVLREAGLSAERFLNDPWGEGSASELDRLAQLQGDILLLGSGLTAVDMALSLNARGFRGRLTVLSRRGLVPRQHDKGNSAPLSAPPEGGLRALVRSTRQRAVKVGWIAAVDALRPFTVSIWQRLSMQERRSFLRHLRPWWDVHRHRIAPQIASSFHKINLEVLAGRIQFVRSGDSAVELGIGLRGGCEARREVAAIVNCTGPAGDIRRTPDPFISELLRNGTAAADPLSLGLEVDECCRLSGSERIYAVGPLTKGMFWEMVAVPDIRGQVQKVAASIASNQRGHL
jgi:uncharacterized NAD(P)/FAD-binding protein YdhS